MEDWSEIKPVWKGRSIVATSRSSQVCQSYFSKLSTYTIGNVYCYFYGPFGSPTGQITLSIFNGDTSGKPSTIITSDSIEANSITQDGWYKFEINISGTFAASKYLSFVISSNGTDEQNFVEIGYFDSSEVNKSYFSENGEWKIQKYGWAIVVNQDVDLFDLENFRINVSPSSKYTNEIKEYSNEVQNGTENVSDDTIKISYPNIIASFVVDRSGSLGNVDRQNAKKTVLQTFAHKLNEKYPATVRYDLVRFGGATMNSSRFGENITSVATININLSTPTRTTYTFSTETDIGVADGDIYTHNGNEYEIIGGGSYLNSFYALGSVDPLPTGELTISSGIGNALIFFNGFSKATVDDGVIAWGFKNLQNGHTYNISSIESTGVSLNDITTKNANLFYYDSVSPSLTIGENGPNDDETLDVLAYNSLIFRKNITKSSLLFSKNIEAIAKNQITTTVVSDSQFTEELLYDIVDGDIASTAMRLRSKDSSQLEFYEGASTQIKNQSWNTIVQQSAAIDPVIFTDPTISILIKDDRASQKITFFLQTKNGVPIEWDFYAFKEWTFSNLFWLGDTASFDFSIFDEDGVPFPDGTRVDIYVDENATVQSESIQDKKLVRNAYINDDIIYIDSLDGIARGQTYDITDGTNSQVITIKDSGTLGSESYITINEVLGYDFAVANNSKIMHKIADTIQLEDIASEKENAINFTPTIENITQVLTGQTYAGELKSFDKPAIESASSYEAKNNSKAYFNNPPISIPTLSGVSAFRVLPITEDSYKTRKQQKSDIRSLSKQASEFFPPSQQIKDDSDIVQESEEELVITQKDYSIETPVFSIDGIATSTMTSSATQLEVIGIPGLYIQGANESAASTELKLFAKTYQIQAVISVTNENNAVVAKQILEPSQIFFASPFNVFSSLDGQTTKYIGLNYEKIASGDTADGIYIEKDVPGVYANGNEYVINYTVINRKEFIKDGILNIKIYSNKNVDIERFATETKIYSSQFINIKDSNSSIDKWREIVEGKDTAYTELVNKISVTPYSDSDGWTLAKQYDVYETTVSVINGQASITIPVNDTISVLMVEASFDFTNGQNFESIRTDYVFVSNPITLGIFSPDSAIPETGQELYESGVKIKWQNNTDIDNGTVVELGKTKTKISPSVSQTIDGYALGFLFGPHKPIISRIDENNPNPAKPAIDIFDVTVSHTSGYTLKTKRAFIWVPQEITIDESLIKYRMYATLSSDSTWSDGTTSNQKIQIDNGDAINANIITSDSNGIPILWIGNSSELYMNGLGQPNGDAATVQSLSKYALQKQSRFVDGRANIDILPINENTGYDSKYVTVKLTSSYYDYGDDGRKILITRHATTNSNDEGREIVYPEIIIDDPLRVDLYIESPDSIMPRNGVATVNVVADVSWKRNRLTENIVIDSGTENERTIFHNLPIVEFSAGRCIETNEVSNPPENATAWELAKDKRGPFTSCLNLESIPEISLSKYAEKVGYFRTNRHTDGSGNIHVHECVVSPDGNGATTRTIVLKGTVSNHTHTITGFDVATASGHNHTVRSVAITTINPVTDPYSTITVKGVVVYDPTDCNPYGKEPKIPYKNRKSFNSADALGTKSYKKKLVLDLSTSTDLSQSVGISESGQIIYYTAKDIFDYRNGFDIKARLYYTEYFDYSNPNNPVYIPETVVSNGARVNFSIDSFSPSQNAFLNEGLSLESTDDVHVVAFDKKRLHMVLHIKASACVDGEYVENMMRIIVASTLQWLPLTSAAFSLPIEEFNSFETKLLENKTIGSSQIFDAMYLAAGRIIDNLSENEKSVVVMYTDGEENSSTIGFERLLNIQKIYNDRINFVIINNSNQYQYGKIVSNSLTNESDGVNIKFADGNDVGKLINKIITSENFSINNGIYENEIERDDGKNISSINVDLLTNPSGSKAKISYFSELDQNGVWTNKKDVGTTESIDENFDNLKYRIELTGNSEFESPVVNKYLEATEVEDRQTIVYFKPEPINLKEDEYVSSILATAVGDIGSENIEIGYAFTKYQIDDAEKINFNWISLNKTAPLPNRYTEVMKYIGNNSYSLQYGGFNDESVSVEKLDIDGILIKTFSEQSFEYSAKNGEIRFKSPEIAQNGEIYVARITRGCFVNLAIKATNRTESTKYIDHIGVSYNISKRFVRGKNGNTLSFPLKKKV